MLKDNWGYFVLGLLFVLYVLVEYYSPKPLIWKETYHHKDKYPYGSYILFDRLEDLFPNYETSHKTVPELAQRSGNLVITASVINFTDTEISKVMDKVYEGNTVLLSASQFNRPFLDSLKLSTDYTYDLGVINDSTVVDFKGDKSAMYPENFFGTYFEVNDSTIEDAEGDKWTILASVSGNPVMIKRKLGKGEIVLSTTPLIFTNYGVLINHTLAELALSQLPYETVHFTYFYQLGKVSSKSPFRYVLSQVALRWALYLTLFIILAFMILNSQRRQKVIPVVSPPVNTTVDYVKTLAALFRREKSYAKAKDKLVQHFLRKLHRRYGVPPSFSDKYYLFIAKKTGLEQELVKRIFSRIEKSGVSSLNEGGLETLYKDIQRIDNG